MAQEVPQEEINIQIIDNSSNNIHGLLIKELFDSQKVHDTPNGESASNRRFLAKLPKKPDPLPLSNKPILPNAVASILATAGKKRYVGLTGLKFCNMLNGAVVDGTTFIYPLNSTLAAANPSSLEFAKLIDEHALKTYDYIFEIYADVEPQEASRFACYSVAEGANPIANFSSTKLTVKLDAINYFSDTLPSLKKSDSMITGPRKRYKLAYLFIIQEKEFLQQSKMLIETLDDGQAIILVHIDKDKTEDYNELERYLKDRLHNTAGNVFLARNRYNYLQGHISSVFIHLSGYFELLDLADWDYVINLSSVDWPLRRNNEIHRILELHPGYSYVDYWVDTESIADRHMRPHLGSKDNTKNIHPPELGITAWPFAYWQTFKQMEWMILSRSAIEYFRTDNVVLSFLALMEHAKTPEESFFITGTSILIAALVNDPKQKTMLVPDKKRFVRVWGDYLWVGWQDKHLFPIGAKNPQYLFFRPFNALGDFFGETKLVDWIRDNHLDMNSDSHAAACRIEHLGYRDECIYEIVSQLDKNEIILVPVNRPFYEAAMNLRCSMESFGIHNVLFWSLDIETHEKITEEGYLSFYVAEDDDIPDRKYPEDPEFNLLLKKKPYVIRKLISSGFNVWYLDADTVVLRDFRLRAKEYIKVHKADIILSIGNSEHVPSTDSLEIPPKVNAGIMYFTNSLVVQKFLERVNSKLNSQNHLNDQQAIQSAIEKSNIVYTGIGVKAKHEEYPETSTNISRIQKDIRTENSGLLYNMLSFTAESKVKVHFFDHTEFINGPYYHSLQDIPSPSPFKIIHFSGTKNPEMEMKSKKLWLLNDRGKCLEKDQPIHTAPV
ncbi:hypothetical protein HDV06_007041 [Boothiomyces sp. JEL0866]|nr:hypothetical protein HDV06_007041 [Boothiomyces sp. JEL0866]